MFKRVWFYNEKVTPDIPQESLLRPGYLNYAYKIRNSEVTMFSSHANYSNLSNKLIKNYLTMNDQARERQVQPDCDKCKIGS